MTDRDTHTLVTARRAWLALGLVAAVAGVAVLFAFNPAESRFYPLCYLHLTTGLLCPGCGGLRAMHQLLHGHLAEAFRFNPLLVLALPVAVGLAARAALRRWRGQPAASHIHPAWLWIGVAAVSLFGILRNLPYPALAWMAP